MYKLKLARLSAYVSDPFIMFPGVFVARSLTRSSKTPLRAFNIAQFRIQGWSIPDSGAPFSTSYRCFGCSRPDSAALDRTSLECNSVPNMPLPKNCPTPQLLIPSIYVPMTSSWRPFKSVSEQGVFCQGSLLRVVSWNIDFMAPGRASRASAAMAYLKEVFGDPPPPLVIMLQEVHSQSLEAIVSHSWIRNNFVLSNIEPPPRYFTLMMVSQQVQAESWFRMPLPSRMGRDALVVDIPVLPPGTELKHTSSFLRLCTTHLESLPEAEGQERRPLQLAQISGLLKAPPTARAQIIAGLVGGDMNPISSIDAASHEAEDVKLRDVWEETPAPPIPLRKPFQKDLTYGRARGNTWGYQSRAPRARKRLDKFFFTGSAETVPLPEAQDLTGKVGRLGIAVKTRVEVWESERVENLLVKGKIVQKSVVRHVDLDSPWRKDLLKIGVRKEIDTWVSDHFGITVGFRVR